MKYKLSIMTLVFLGLLLAFSGMAFAAAGDLVVTATSDPATNNVTVGDSLHVVQAFTVTADAAGGNSIDTIVLNGSVGGGTDMVATNDSNTSNDEITRVAIYEDVNGNGSFDFNDTFVMQKTSEADMATFAAGALSFDITNVTLAASGTKKYLAVISVATTLDDSHSIDASVTVTATGAGAMTALAGGNDDNVVIAATHLQFKTTGIKYQVATGAEMLQAGGPFDLLWAVDDYGNKDLSYAGEVVIKFEAYTDGTDQTANAGTIAKVGDGGGGLDIRSNQAVNFASFTAGVLQSNTVDTAGQVFSLKYTTAGPITVVAKADPANAGSDDLGLEGSITVCNEAYNTVTGVATTRGVEVYDMDHNGHIDRATIFFNAPMNINGTTNTAFAASGYTLTGTPAVAVDNGGVGVRNAGQYGVTLYLTEKTTFDTATKPDVTYTASAGALRDLNTPTNAPSIVSNSAIEVDKARPILLSITTNDADSDGLVDGIKMTFSEPVSNVLANTASYAAGADIGNFAVALQNTLQGGGATSISLSGTVSTLPSTEVTVSVNETIPNTGILPVLLFKEGNATYTARDAATSATGANAYNQVWTLVSNYAASTGRAKNVTDNVSPIITNVTTNNNDLNGKIDRLAVTFSEPMNDVAANAYPGVSGYSSVSGFGSNGAAAGTYTTTAASFNAGKDVVTYTITEIGTGKYDTEAKPTIYYNPTTGNLRDANGFELAEYGTSGRSVDTAQLIDGAKPQIVSVETGDALTDTATLGLSAFDSSVPDGRLDRLTITFSEQIKNASTAASDAKLKALLAQFAFTHEDGGAASGGGALYQVSPVSTDAGGYAGTLVQYDSKAVPTWTDVATGDTKSTIVTYFYEMNHAWLTNVGNSRNGGDTGVLPTIAYTAAGNTNDIKDMNDVALANYGANAAKTIDKAAPFIVNGVGQAYGAASFANVITFDDSAAVAVSDSYNGDGYIDSFTLKLSEQSRFLSANAGADSIAPAFTVNVASGNSTITLNGGVDANADGKITAADANFSATNATFVVYGTSSKVADKWDTGTTPTLTFDGSKTIVYDLASAANSNAYLAGTSNTMASFSAKPSYDGAAPVIVRATGSVASTSVLIHFSEPVYNNANTLLNSALPNGSTLIKYDDYNNWGAKNVTTAAITAPSTSSISVTVDSTLVLSDVTSDLIHVINAAIYDNANSVETALSDNVVNGAAGSKPAGLMITINDTIAPWITEANTVDADGNGLIDHIRFKFSESVKDANIKGFSAINTLSADVAATWIISNYTGTAKWNFFEATDAGRLAAFNAGEPVFNDNAANDNILYLRLDEANVPVSQTSVGSTNFKPTITFGTGANAETLSDFKPNTLNTNSTDTSAVNGNVSDNVGPVLMSAKTISTQKLQLTFSEDISLTSINRDDFYWMLSTDGRTPETADRGWQNYVERITEPSAGVVVLETTPLGAWTADMAGYINVPASGSISDVATTHAGAAAAKTNAAAAGDDAYAASLYYSAATATTSTVTVVPVASPVNTQAKIITAYSASTNKGFMKPAITISVDIPSNATKTLAVTAPMGATDLTAGTNVDVTWTATNTTASDQVKVIVGDGTTWTVVASGLPATGVKYVWTATMGMSYIKVQLESDNQVIGMSNALTVVAGSGGSGGPAKTIAATDLAAELTAGTAVNVMWAAANYSNNDRVDVLAYNGANWTVIASNYPVNADCVSWNPMVGVTKIKVQLAGDITVLDETADFVVNAAPVDPGAPDPGVTKIMANDVASNLTISNKNVTRVNFSGTATAGDTVSVKLVDMDDTEVMVDVVANATGKFAGQIDASPLANGMVTIKAGKSVAGVVAAWYMGADYQKETVVVGAPAALVVTDVPNDQGGFVDLSFTKSANDVGNPSDFYSVDYYVLQAKKGTLWYTVATFLPDGNTDTTYRALGVWVGTESISDTLRINAHVKLNGASKVADAPDAMSSAYAMGSGTAIDNILPGAFVSFNVDGTMGTGVDVKWTAPADHGLFNAQYNIWGVDGYEVYRRVAGTTDYTKVGTVAPGVSEFVDAVANGSTVYEYMVKAVDGSQMVMTSVNMAMATKGSDFNGDNTVGLGDLVLMGNHWGQTSTSANFISNFDLNKDGVIGLGDLVLMGNAWGQTTLTAKVAGETPVSNIAFSMVPTASTGNSMYFVSINTQNVSDIKGVAFGLTYDASKFDFVPESVTGLGEIQIVKPGEGIISVASLYNSDSFKGTITLGFKSKGMNSVMNVEMVNAEVSLNGVVSSVSNAAGVTLKAVPSTYSLTQNFPNPFNPTTTIEYSIPTAGNVSLVVYNVAGQKVRTLVNNTQSASFYKVVWDGKNDNGMTVGTGTYFYKLVSGNYSKIVKMTLMK